MAQLLARTAQQKDNLCGSFCTARILNDLGFDEWDGEPLDEDLIARLADAALPAPDLPPFLPPGAVSRTSYRYELAIAPIDEVGTSPAALVKAIESATSGRLRAVPVRGGWTAHRVEQFVERATRLGARLIANIDTGRLWGGRPSPDQLLDELNGVETAGPAPDWEVGHFVELTMLIRGPRGSLVVVHDTYPTLGWGGYHMQPPRIVALALLRGDGRQGGILAVVPPDQAGGVAGMAREIGLEEAVWDNGCRS